MSMGFQDFLKFRRNRGKLVDAPMGSVWALIAARDVPLSAPLQSASRGPGFIRNLVNP